MYIHKLAITFEINLLKCKSLGKKNNTKLIEKTQGKNLNIKL